MTVELVTYDNLETVRDLWFDYESNGVYFPFQRYEWIHEWYSIPEVQKKIKPYIVEVRTLENTPRKIMLMPLGIEINRRKTLVWLGDLVSDYMAPIFHKDGLNFLSRLDVNAILTDCIKLAPVRIEKVRLDKQPETIKTVKNPFIKHAGCRKSGYSSHRVRIEQGFPDTRKIRKIKSDSRRQLKRLEKLGALRTIINDEDYESAVNLMLEWKHETYERTGVKSAQHTNPDYDAFYKRIFGRLFKKGIAHVSRMELEGIPIAIHVGLVDESSFYYLMPAYHSGSISRFSGGRILMEQLIQWGVSKNLQWFDLTIGDESYKLDWASESEAIYETIVNISLLSKLDDAIEKIRKVVISNAIPVLRWPWRLAKRIFNVLRIISARISALWKKRVLILMYHRVVPNVGRNPLQICTSYENFKQHLDILRSKYTVIGIDDLVSQLEQKKFVRKRQVVITFDDGYVDNVRYAAPLLNEAGLPAIVYIATGYTNQTLPFWSDEAVLLTLHSENEILFAPHPLNRVYYLGDPESRAEALYDLLNKLRRISVMERERLLEKISYNARPVAGDEDRAMRGEELKNLASFGISLGAHSQWHPALSAINATEAKNEINGSKKELEQLLNSTVRHFAYPFDDREYRERKVPELPFSIVSSGEFDSAVSVVPGVNSETQDPFSLRRMHISNQSKEEFENLISKAFLHG